VISAVKKGGSQTTGTFDLYLVWLEIWEQLSSVGSFVVCLLDNWSNSMKKSYSNNANVVHPSLSLTPWWAWWATKPQAQQLMPLQAIQTPHCALNEYYLSKSRSDQIKSRERQYQSSVDSFLGHEIIAS
jgi:hypothetical protein